MSLKFYLKIAQRFLLEKFLEMFQICDSPEWDCHCVETENSFVASSVILLNMELQLGIWGYSKDFLIRQENREHSCHVSMIHQRRWRRLYRLDTQQKIKPFLYSFTPLKVSLCPYAAVFSFSLVLVLFAFSWSITNKAWRHLDIAFESYHLHSGISTANHIVWGKF